MIETDLRISLKQGFEAHGLSTPLHDTTLPFIERYWTEAQRISGTNGIVIGFESLTPDDPRLEYFSMKIGTLSVITIVDSFSHNKEDMKRSRQLAEIEWNLNLSHAPIPIYFYLANLELDTDKTSEEILESYNKKANFICRFPAF